MDLYLVAGEASGDARGAELMRALKAQNPGFRFHGAGGHTMRELAGDDFTDWADEAVVGLWDVLKKYGYFRAQFDRMLAQIVALKPEALILIDYPGFNLRFAKAVRAKLPATKIIYYISPQVWAWNRGRIPKMARLLDLMLCIFPFEKPLYEKSGLKTVFVGHPMLDTLAEKRGTVVRQPNLVALLPGSRSREVRKIFPTMVAVAMRLRLKRSDLCFEAAAASEPLASEMRSILRESGVDETLCRITLKTSHDLMQKAAVGMVASGTATLEAAYFGLPFVLLYKVAWLTWFVGKRLVRLQHIGMPNILAGREIVREFLQNDAQPEPIVPDIEKLLNDPKARQDLQGELSKVISKLGEPGAGVRAAAAVCESLGVR